MVFDFINSKFISFTNKIEDLKSSNIYIITVPSPITSSKNPNLKNLSIACKNIGKYMSYLKHTKSFSLPSVLSILVTEHKEIFSKEELSLNKLKVKKFLTLYYRLELVEWRPLWLRV